MVAVAPGKRLMRSKEPALQFRALLQVRRKGSDMRFSSVTLITSIVGLAAGSGLAQEAVKVEALTEIAEADVVTADGTEVGEIEDVLIDASGNVVVSVEVEDFLGIGGEDVIFALSELTYQDGNFVTALDKAEIGSLPRYED
jgi:NADH dehydrogenase/NADH:ubiquinone oxidoreductase subunit G